eukprot:Gb_11583 [translate_table: standard]
MMGILMGFGIYGMINVILRLKPEIPLCQYLFRLNHFSVMLPIQAIHRLSLVGKRFPTDGKGRPWLFGVAIQTCYWVMGTLNEVEEVQLDVQLRQFEVESLHGQEKLSIMRRHHWEMTKNMAMGELISAVSMAWKHKYISDDQWEELYWEFFNCCSFVWRHPIHTAAFLYCAPSLIKILLFFYPLLISTFLFLLLIYSLGPQLERMKADRDLQWKRFREAAVNDDNSGSWASQQSCRKFAKARGVNRQVACTADHWADWPKSLKSCHQSILYTEGQFSNNIEKDDLKVDFDTVAEEEVEQKEAFNISSKSIILDKLRDLMERLIAELGGRVELDALNALETITQILIESTGRDYQKQGKNWSFIAMGTTENELSDEGNFPKSDFVGECPLIGRPITDEGRNVERLEHVPSENIDPNKLQRDSAVPGSSVEDSCSVGSIDISRGMEKGNTSLESVQVFLSGPQDGEGSLSPQDKLQTEDGLSGPQQYLLRPCKSFPHDASKGEFRCMDKWWEEGDFFGQKASLSGREKVWKKKLVDKCSEEHREQCKAGKFDEEEAEVSCKLEGQLSSIPARIPEKKNDQRYMNTGKLRSTPSEPITFINRPQFLTSPVMLLDAKGMDLLWEEYNDAPRQEPESPIKGHSTYPDLSGTVDSDAEDGSDSPQVCCLKAMRFSKGRMPLKKPNFTKISKALKKLGLIQHFRGQKQPKGENHNK